MRRVFLTLLLLEVVSSAQNQKSRATQPSLQTGIANTQQAIKQTSLLLGQNQEDLSKIFAGSGLDFLEKAGGVEVIGKLRMGYSAAELGSAVDSGDYAKALMNAAKLIATAWGQLDPRVKLGKAGVELSGEIYETQSLLRQQARLIETLLTLQQQLFRLRGKSPLDLARLDEIRAALEQDAALHQEFLNSLAKYNLDRGQVAAAALKMAPSKSNQVASGMIVDPQTDIEGTPGINPDFIKSMRRQFELLQLGGEAAVTAAGMANKYPNGSYIPIFLPGGGPVPVKLGTLNPLEVGHGIEGVRYFASFADQGRRSNIYVALLMTEAQARAQPQPKQFGWCSALLYNGAPIPVSRGNLAHVSACTSLYDGFRLDNKSTNEKGQFVKNAAGEQIYWMGDSFIDPAHMEFSGGGLAPGNYTVNVCPPYRPVDRITDGMGPDNSGTACHSYYYRGPSGYKKQEYSPSVPPMRSFAVELSQGISATVTVKVY